VASVGVLFLAWVNLHGGFIAGSIFLVLTTGGAWIDYKRTPREKGRRGKSSPGADEYRFFFVRCFAATGAMAIALMCNPVGWKIVLFPFALSDMPVLRELVMEWKGFVLDEKTVPFLLLLTALVARLPFVWRRARIADLLALAAFSYLAFDARRHVSLFFFVVAPIASEWYGPLVRRFVLFRGRKRRKALGMAAIGIAAAWWWMTGFALHGFRYGIGFNEDFVPRRAMECIREWKLSPEVFNSYNLGGFMVYALSPDWRVFVDGRIDLYRDAVINSYMDVLTGKTGWEDYLEYWKVDTILLDMWTDANCIMAKTLARSPDWALVYWDDKSALYVRDIPEHADVIRAHQYRYIDPCAVASELEKQWKNPEESEVGLADLERRVSETPPCYQAARTLGFILGRRPDRISQERALEATDLCLRLRPDDPAMLYREGQLLELLGRPEKARRSYERALRRNSKDGAPALRLAVIDEKAEDFKSAEQYYRMAKNASVPPKDATLEFARFLARREQWKSVVKALSKHVKIHPEDAAARELLDEARTHLVPGK
jgi:hypothetical protein